MKRIAFAGTYNEQIFDSEKKEIRWTGPEANGLVVREVAGVFGKIWKKPKE